MHRSLKAAAAMLSVALVPSTAHAQEEIAVEPYEAYTIPGTSLSFPATLGDSVREKLIRFGEGDYNIGSTYYRRDNDDIVSLYFYRMAAGSVPVWFDRVATLLEGQNRLGVITGHSDMDLADLEGGPGAAMIRIWSLDGDYRSTALLLAQQGDMLVKLRVSSKELPAEALAEFVQQLMLELAVPFDRTTPFVPVTDCQTPLQPFAKKVAKIAKDEDDGMVEGLMAAVMGNIVREKIAEEKEESKDEAVAPMPFCRENASSGIYRREGTDSSYLIALQDSGVSVSVGRATSLVGLINEKDDAMAYRATVHQTTKDIMFPEMDGFPSPQGAIDFIQSENPVSSVNTAGDRTGNIEITM